MGLSPVVDDKCMHCGTDISRRADEAPLCPECLDALPSEADLEALEIYVILGFEGPMETLEEHQGRLETYREWLDDPDLQNPPPGCDIVGEAATVELAFQHAPDNAMVIAARRTIDASDQATLAPVACVLKFPLAGFPGPDGPQNLMPEVEVQVSTQTEDELRARLKRAEELRDQAVRQCDRMKQRWLRVVNNDRADKIRAGELGDTYLDCIGEYMGRPIYVEREIKRVATTGSLLGRVIDDSEEWDKFIAEIRKKLQG